MKPTLKHLFLLGAAAWVALMAGCASQDAMYSIDSRLSALEQQTTSQDGQEQNIRSQSADLRAEMDMLTEQVQLLNGRMEESLWEINRKISTLEDADRKRQQDLAGLDESTREDSEAIQRVSQYLNLEQTETETSGTTPATASAPPPDVVKEAEDDQLYITAKQAFDREDFEASRNGFTELIRKFPKSKHADNAQFWIGDTYYREKWYEKAILEYQKVIENYPKGNKVQAALLKQGFSFINLDDSANARLILKELVRKYPKSNEADIARKKLAGMK